MGDVELATDLADLIEVVPLEELIPYENNPKEHPPEQVAKIKDSILEYGYTVPMIVNEEGRVVAGHGRLEALRELDVEEAAVIRRSDLSDAQVKAFRLADNRVAESPWDDERLAVELEALKERDFELELTGFDADELEDLLASDDGRGGVDYTDKIETPEYEPTGRQPDVSDLYDAGRYEGLMGLIEEADPPDELRRFLELAAQRHVVFDYEDIAEFYAHQDAETQELMEALTLVIVDYDRAVEQGFVDFAEEALTGGDADA